MKLVEVSKLKIDLIDFLLQKGFDINFENDDRLTPLHYILQYWNYPEGRVTSLYDKTKILLDKGAKIDSESSVGDTPLMLAIKAKEIRVVKLLISLGANVNRRNNQFKDTPLHRLSCRQSGEYDQVMQILIDNGAEVDAQARINLNTPLHINILNKGSIKNAKVLLANGSKLLLKNAYGETAFHLALQYHDTKFIKLALEFQPSLVLALNSGKDHLLEHILRQANICAFKMIIYHCHKYMYCQ